MLLFLGTGMDHLDVKLFNFRVQIPRNITDCLFLSMNFTPWDQSVVYSAINNTNHGHKSAGQDHGIFMMHCFASAHHFESQNP